MEIESLGRGGSIVVQEVDQLEYGDEERPDLNDGGRPMIPERCEPEVLRNSGQ